MIREVDNPIKEITLTFEDGTTQTLNKGFVGAVQDDRLRIEFSSMSGEEVLAALYYMLEFAARVVNQYKAKSKEEQTHAQSTENESRR